MMGTDDFHKKRKRDVGREARRSANKLLNGEHWLIVCEGEKTEPLYFEELIAHANEQSEQKVYATIRGTGRNTESLVKYTELLESINTFRKKKISNYDKIFVVFDKDSFQDEQFNASINKAKNMEYIPIWSNECVELWFLLHFIYFDAAISRKEYVVKLKAKLKGRYKKADNHFTRLQEHGGDIKKAYKNAMKLYGMHSISGESFAKQKPCTMIFQMIDCLESSLNIRLK